MAASDDFQSVAEHFAPCQTIASSLLPHAFDAGDGSHDLAHLIRVWRNASTIAGAEGGNLDVLVPAVVLHDCVAVEKNSPLRSQASRMAAEKASGLLSSMGLDGALVSSVAHAIEAHSFSGGVEPRTLEAAILRDADRLDAIGAMGIARCFYVSGRLGRPLYDPVDPQAKARPLDDMAFAIDHFPVKLLGLAESMLTETGRKLAAVRRDRMERFLDEFFAEASATT